MPARGASSTASARQRPAAVSTEFVYEPGRVQLDQLEFDPDNPRLPASVDGRNEADVLRWMLDDATLLDLAGAIAEEGFFPGEPLLVSPRPEGISAADALAKKTQKFVVVEGNRRLAAVRLLNDPARAPTRKRAIESIARSSRLETMPTELPVIVFPNRMEVLDHLGFRHVTGIKQWTPLAKANYVDQLVSRANERGEALSLDEIAAMIGSKPWYVARLLATLAAVDRITRDRGFFKSLDVQEEELPFSLMLVALSRENIVSFLGLHSAGFPSLAGVKVANLKRLAVWLFKPRENGKTALGESRNMTLLAEIVTSKDAMDHLDAGEQIRTAALFALEGDEIFSVSVEDADKNLDIALKQRRRVSTLSTATRRRVSAIATKAGTLESFIEKQPPS